MLLSMSMFINIMNLCGLFCLVGWFIVWMVGLSVALCSCAVLWFCCVFVVFRLDCSLSISELLTLHEGERSHGGL